MHNILNNLSGKVLGIGLTKDMVKLIDANDKIKECDLLDSYSKKNKEKSSKGKILNIKKLRKYFKKKKIDYIVCNYKTIEKYLNSFVKDSIYVNKYKLYFFNFDDEVIEKYKRYNSKISFTKEYLEIDNENVKTNFFKDNYFNMIDFIKKIVELIGNFLMN